MIQKFVHFSAKDTIQSTQNFIWISTSAKWGTGLHPRKTPVSSCWDQKSSCNMNLITTTVKCWWIKEVEKSANKLTWRNSKWQRSKQDSSISEGAMILENRAGSRINNPTEPPCRKTWNNRGPESNYYEVQTPHWGNGAANKHLINFWSKEIQKWKINACADDEATWNYFLFNIDYETICWSRALIHLNCWSLLRSFEVFKAGIEGLSRSPIAIALSETWLNDKNILFPSETT